VREGAWERRESSPLRGGGVYRFEGVEEGEVVDVVGDEGGAGVEVVGVLERELSDADGRGDEFLTGGGGG
jgi:hypothetical protein